ncbi:MAG TPA: gliding motility-associated C-terminal domain-containing protein [Saprospiraceae bacterium]|nr:gliding motility-associated C-terminal domain-containing protein [Saprospiraceae bacterium]
MQKPKPIFKHLLCLLFFLLPLIVGGQAFSVTVNTTDDTDDGRCSAQHCSYREALNLANGFQGEMFIFFDIPGIGRERRILLTSDLPALSNFGALTIDGTSQQGAEVVVDGNGDINFGLHLEDADNTVVGGIHFDNLRLAGIYAEGNSFGTIIGSEKGGNRFTGSRYGVVIEGQRALIRNNEFDNNDINGVFVAGNGSAFIGEQDNPAAGNTFLNHRFAGVEAGERSNYVNIFGNSFYCNEAEGITNFNRSNNGIDKPTIQDASTSQVSGTAGRNALVQIYAFDPDQQVCQEVNSCQGNIFLGSTIADGSGNWVLSENNFEVPLLPSYELTATQMAPFSDPDFPESFRYTSEFADCFSLCATYDITLTSDGPACPGDTFAIRPNITSNGSNPEPLNYSWTGPGGFSAGTETITATQVGTYTLAATNTCNNIEVSIDIAAQETPPNSITAAYNGPICEFDTLQLFASTAGVLYEWIGPLGFRSSEQNPLVNLGANRLRSGTYYLNTRTPISGCPGPVDSVSVLVKAPPVLQDTSLSVCAANAQEEVADFNLSAIENHIRSGDNSIVLFWFEDEAVQRRITFPEAYTSAGGDAFVLGFDSLGCSSEVVKIPLTVLPALSVNLTVEQEITCTTPDGGSLLASVANGAQPFVYEWSPTEVSGNNPTGLSSRRYDLTVTDANGCQGTASVRLEAPDALVLDCSIVRDISRVGAEDGAAQIRISRGLAPYELRIPNLNDTIIQLSAAGSLELNNLPAGVYEVQATDANDCTQNCRFEIAEVDCSNFILELNQRPSSCPEIMDGLLSANPMGGQAPFSYDWSDNRFDGQSRAEQLAAGNYGLTVTDARGCIAIATATIEAANPRPTVSIGTGNTLCPGACIEVALTFTGEAPFLLNYALIANGDTLSQETNFDTSEENLTICAEIFPKDTESITLRVLELFDANCSAPLNESTIIPVSPVSRGLLDTVLCPGSFLLINGTTYDQNNPFGQELLAGAAQGGCDSLLDINIFFPSAPMVTNVERTCDLANNTFVVTFDLLGLAPFSITGIEGQVYGDRFVSTNLAAAGSYNLTITDGFGCSGNLDIEAPDCSRSSNCTFRAGTLAAFAENICQYDTLQLSTLGDEQLTDNQRQLFVIHNGSANELGDILLRDQEGHFPFEAPLNLGTPYFTAVLAGRDNGFGRLDENDPCLDIKLGAAVQFNTAPRRPLFIQGQDTLCVGENLQLSTENLAGANLVYNWITPQNDTLQSDSNRLVIPNVTQDAAGIYSIFAQSGSCSSPVFSPHQLVVNDFPFLYAGDDQESCGLNQAMLQADPISFGEGSWSSPTTATIINTEDPFSLVRDLEAGQNPFIWTVATDDCVSTDTVLINYFPTPILADDEFQLEPGLSRITFDGFANDRVEGLILDSTTVKIITQPEVGSVRYLPAEQVFEYTAELGNAEAIAFEYSVCPSVCPEACDTAFAIINLPDVLLEVPDGIVRGRANSGLRIGNLEAFPDNEAIITNRWGVVVYRQKNYSNDNPWQGTHNGADLPQGTYYLYLKVEGRRSVVTKAIHLIVR